MKKLSILLFSFFLSFSLVAQNQEIKNVIVMIPDGTSTSVLSLARWYKGYVTNNYTTRLAIDPYLCGLVKTHSSDAPIGDSAPTTSCYMTGQPTQVGFVSTYPVKTDHDLVPIDATRAYQPLVTVFEAARLLKGKAIGLIATSYIADATPADCMSHSYIRSRRDMITKEFVHNGVDVLLGGGNEQAKKYEDVLKSKGVNVVFDDITEMRENQSAKLWALFGKREMPYHLDADTNDFPSLAEMTSIAIQCLSQDSDGFALMVEGSKVDWAAHNNDAKTVIDEFLEFDKAVEVVMNFAQKDGHTLVLIMPDHGNSAISMGNSNTNKTYTKAPLSEFMQPLTEYSISVDAMGDLLASSDNAEIKPLFKKQFNFDIEDEDIQTIIEEKKKDDSNTHSKLAITLPKIVSKILYKNLNFGFTTYAHTGEDVFLAAYHPFGKGPSGLLTNIEINQYLCKALGIENQLPLLTDELFAKHQDVFEGFETKIEKINDNPKDDNYRLTVKNKKQKIEIESFTNYFLLNGEKIDLESVIIYVDKNETFYLPKKIREYLK
ncbi:MAG: alkaline phosphatase [Bacteroidales bacterium]|nr:alkaline phosphatase [Bacteroidales bacterium]